MHRYRDPDQFASGCPQETGLSFLWLPNGSQSSRQEDGLRSGLRGRSGHDGGLSGNSGKVFGMWELQHRRAGGDSSDEEGDLEAHALREYACQIRPA